MYQSYLIFSKEGLQEKTPEAVNWRKRAIQWPKQAIQWPQQAIQ